MSEDIQNSIDQVKARLDENLADLAELAEKFETRGKPARQPSRAVVIANWSATKAMFTMKKSRVRFVNIT